MSEDKFEEFLRREAQAYNTPPAAAPRDEMWAAIERSRASARRVAAVVAPGSTTARRRARYAPWIGMAATLLVGVGIGRYAMDRGPAALLQPDTTVSVGTASIAIDAPSSDASSSDLPFSDADADAGRALAATPGDRGPEAGRSVAPTAGRDRAVRAPRQSQPVRVAEDASTTPGASPFRASMALSPTYEVASQRHLQRAEALVAVVAAAPRDPMMDSLTSLWARDVLSNTRLMLDSPVGDDPIRRRLLEDLENLLVQLVQRSGPAGEERALIDRTLRRTQLLTRLRTSASGT